MTRSVTDLHRTLKIGRRASRTACDAERRTIVDNQSAFLSRYY
ncbi:DUF1534 domain-containing protein [Pseudomonas syringae pv. maculicola str. ES4326]|uniref:DUF1534 domain-containing protein n=1 Tax=Pseudomonas syringae pv. maculicola str. ES4326 TaxID=629265 RepID=A0A8T8C430_PSEYM|nr:DUF1534 domain-containing protein [Pseudomonas syringae pv. maculicola str. ES4326]